MGEDLTTKKPTTSVISQLSQSEAHRPSIMDIVGLVTRNVTTISPEDSVMSAARIVFEKNYDGLPVVDTSGRLIGILTQYDLVSKGESIHLPTVMQLLKNAAQQRADRGVLEPGLRRMISLKVKEVMNDDPLTVSRDAWLDDVARIFSEHHRVNPIPVIDDQRHVVGILSRYDLIRLYTGNLKIDATNTAPDAVDAQIDSLVDQFDTQLTTSTDDQDVRWYVAGIVVVVILCALALILFA